LVGRDIFISYSREDRPAAKYFAETLAEEGFSVWWDAALHSGESFDQVIERELRSAAAVIVLWSPRSVDSRWVRAEATLADRHGKLVPITIENCERPIIFELTHTNDLSDWVGDKTDPRWKGLVKDVARLVGERKGDAPSAASRPAPAKKELEPAMPNLVWDAGAAVKARPAEDDSQATQFFVGADYLDIFHCLEIADGEQPERRFIVAPQGIRIGRTPPADIILPDRQVSRSHCMVELHGSVLKVTDLGSTNGTYVDGKRVEQSALLPVGSSLRIGSVLLRHQVRSSRSLNERKYAVG
jgi:hypothetical protein